MNETNTYDIKGMHCASCANTIEKTFTKTEGVEKAEANYGNESVKVSFDSSKVTPEQLSKKIEPFGYSLILEDRSNTHPNGMHPQVDLTDKMDHSKMNHDMQGMDHGDHSEHLGLNLSLNDKLAELADLKTKILIAIPMAIISIFIMAWDILAMYKSVSPMSHTMMEFFHHLLPLMATYILFVAGKPYLKGVWLFIRYGNAGMDTLIGIGTLAAFLYSFAVTAFESLLAPYINVEHTYYDVTIVVITFIVLGKYLETRSKIRTGDAIEKLLNLQAKTALVKRDGKEIEISVNDVLIGELIIVKPGAKIPVDGIVTEGLSFIDESMITGEPMPVQKKINDSVVAGTLNTSGSFIFKATKIGSETFLAHIIKMVKDAQGSKAPIQAMADKISAVFVPIVMVIAFLSLALWLIFGVSSLGFSQALSYGLLSFVGVLVIACPCALGLATPTAIIVGVGKGAKEGILIKDAATLEKLHKVNTIVVDKTGTITKGKPALVDIKVLSDISEEKLISILASLEKKSEHPLANAVVNYAASKNISLMEVKDFQAIQGKGIQGSIDGIEYFIGSPNLISEMKIDFDSNVLNEFTSQGKTPVLIFSKDNVLGYVMIADEVKEESAQAVKDLHALGIKVIMLTGDDERAARFIGSQVGIDEVIAQVLPQDKLIKIKALQSEGKIVAMAGDGINDAPALAQADIGIAMGTGTDVAIESAGITLLNGDISKLVKAIRLSKITMLGIKQNLFWAFIYNIIGIPLAAGLFFPLFGILLNPVFAGVAMALSSVSVVTNSLRIKTKKL